MKAIICKEYATPDKLKIEEVDDLNINDDQVLIKIEAAGLNYVDSLFVQGLYQIKIPTPFIPGGEVAGVIEEVGKKVDSVSVGDRVIAMVGIGGFAEQVLAYPGQLIPIPDDLDFSRAASMTQSYGTALFSLRQRGDIRPGEKLLVLGAGGGVGLAACDVGSALGATVYAAASSEEKLCLAKSVGAEKVINYVEQSLKEQVRSVSKGGVDMVFDPIGGELSETALRTLVYNGRLLVIGFASGNIPNFPANQILLRNRHVVGVDWGAWSLSNPDLNRELMFEVFDLFAQGKVSPTQPNQFPLGQVGKAMMAITERKVAGKCVLVP